MSDDKTTTLHDLKTLVQKFCDERDWEPYHGPKDLAIGLVTEASELLEIFRFVRERELKPLLESSVEREKMADELADSLYFILRFSELYHFDLSESLRKKLVKNAVKYPVPSKPQTHP